MYSILYYRPTTKLEDASFHKASKNVFVDLCYCKREQSVYAKCLPLCLQKVKRQSLCSKFMMLHDVLIVLY